LTSGRADDTASPEGDGALRALLHRTTLALERYWAAVAHREGVGETELRGLVHLVQARELTPGELAARLGLTSGGTTALIRRVERAGGLTRVADPRDGRRALLRPTPATIERVTALEGTLVGALDAVVRRPSAHEHAVVVGFLDGVVQTTESATSARQDCLDQ